jgi:hypothetical protein
MEYLVFENDELVDVLFFKTIKEQKQYLKKHPNQKLVESIDEEVILSDFDDDYNDDE